MHSWGLCSRRVSCTCWVPAAELWQPRAGLERVLVESRRLSRRGAERCRKPTPWQQLCLPKCRHKHESFDGHFFSPKSWEGEFSEALSDLIRWFDVKSCVPLWSRCRSGALGNLGLNVALPGTLGIIRGSLFYPWIVSSLNCGRMGQGTPQSGWEVNSDGSFKQEKHFGNCKMLPVTKNPTIMAAFGLEMKSPRSFLLHLIFVSE